RRVFALGLGAGSEGASVDVAAQEVDLPRAFAPCRGGEQRVALREGFRVPPDPGEQLDVRERRFRVQRAAREPRAIAGERFDRALGVAEQIPAEPCELV